MGSPILAGVDGCYVPSMVIHSNNYATLLLKGLDDCCKFHLNGWNPCEAFQACACLRFDSDHARDRCAGWISFPACHASRWAPRAPPQEVTCWHVSADETLVVPLPELLETTATCMEEYILLRSLPVLPASGPWSWSPDLCEQPIHFGLRPYHSD
jgi:hypothetical protein